VRRRNDALLEGIPTQALELGFLFEIDAEVCDELVGVVFYPTQFVHEPGFAGKGRHSAQGLKRDVCLTGDLLRLDEPLLQGGFFWFWHCGRVVE